MFRSIQTNLILLILSLVILTVTATWLCLLPDYLLAIPVVFLIIVNILLIITCYNRHIKKITFMFNAIESDDYTFSFSTKNTFKSDKMLNLSLNRIKGLMEQAHINILQHEKYYELIMDCVNTGIVVINDNGNIHQHNKELIRLLNLPVFTHIKQLKPLNENLPDLLLSIQSDEKLHVPITNERGIINLSIRASEMIVNEKRLRILAFNDINSELDEQEIESWIRLTRVLTHEIMNSVTPITSLSDTLIELHGEKDKEIRKGLEIISTTGKGLITFVDSYRKLTRIPPPNLKPFELYDFLENLIRLSGCDYPGIPVRLDVEPSDLMIYADNNLLSQVILNLLKNALQSINKPDKSDNSEVLIKAYSNKEEAVIIEVCDTGCGISDEIAQHVFIPFFTTKENGSGIGLSIARQIMRLHNGTISLKRNIPPFSTIFRLTFN